VKRSDERGFTLPELLVAITILGIIMVAIGAMIVTAFRTTTIVGAQLNASRGPKIVSRYWVPDVESATTVDQAGPCGSGGHAVVTLAWPDDAATVDTPDVAAVDGPMHVVTWWVNDGRRQQMVRNVCANGSPTPTNTTTVVADLAGVPNVDTPTGTGRVYTINVTVPDKSAADKKFDFSVGARQQVTTP
jgi:prepilin-type N-terminal cleavage/methylation domain-containing protein